jgi:glycosyltransferase involved in cell wall biosynthesis
MMSEPLMVREKMAGLKCCVIIPTYNNDGTLAKVIGDVLAYAEHIIVVNDGATDRTKAILRDIQGIDVIQIPENTGKGFALRKGFTRAIERGFCYAITIDSDGQHAASDIPAFLQMIERSPGSVILGARNMKQAGAPGTSNFGHRFSIFWFKVETGIKVADVQTGFRLYPLEEIKKIHRFFTRKYEFEVEILVRLAWRNVNITSVPVNVYYAPKEERITHFRKFRDFTRVSITNAVLVFMALFWCRPFAFLKSLRKKSVRELVNEYIMSSLDTNSKIAFSLAFGAFIGVIPIWGWQMMAAFGLAHVLRLNKFVAVLASNISIPPLLPVILFLSYETGGWILGVHNQNLKYTTGFGLQWMKDNLIQYLTGSLVFGLALAVVLGLVTYILLSIFRKRTVGENPASAPVK